MLDALIELDLLDELYLRDRLTAIGRRLNGGAVAPFPAGLGFGQRPAPQRTATGRDAWLTDVNEPPHSKLVL